MAIKAGWRHVFVDSDGKITQSNNDVVGGRA
jgi:hypothetical protein